MAQDIHTIALVSGGQNLARKDRVLAGFYPAQAYPAGAGAGQSVTLAFTAKGLPAKFFVSATLDQDATWYVVKTGPGAFNLVITPRLAASTLLAGAVDIAVYA